MYAPPDTPSSLSLSTTKRYAVSLEVKLSEKKLPSGSENSRIIFENSPAEIGFAAARVCATAAGCAARELETRISSTKGYKSGNKRRRRMWVDGLVNKTTSCHQNG